MVVGSERVEEHFAGELEGLQEGGGGELYEVARILTVVELVGTEEPSRLRISCNITDRRLVLSLLLAVEEAVSKQLEP